MSDPSMSATPGGRHRRADAGQPVGLAYEVADLIAELDGAGALPGIAAIARARLVHDVGAAQPGDLARRAADVLAALDPAGPPVGDPEGIWTHRLALAGALLAAAINGTENAHG